jgi:hypothetical protein
MLIEDDIPKAIIFISTFDQSSEKL